MILDSERSEGPLSGFTCNCNLRPLLLSFVFRFDAHRRDSVSSCGDPIPVNKHTCRVRFRVHKFCSRNTLKPIGSRQHPNCDGQFDQRKNDCDKRPAASFTKNHFLAAHSSGSIRPVENGPGFRQAPLSGPWLRFLPSVYSLPYLWGRLP